MKRSTIMICIIISIVLFLYGRHEVHNAFFSSLEYSNNKVEQSGGNMETTLYESMLTNMTHSYQITGAATLFIGGIGLTIFGLALCKTFDIQ